MHSRSKSSWSRLLIVPVVIASCLGTRRPARAESPEDRLLESAWALHQNQPDQHAAVIDACTRFEKGFPADPLVAVARGLAAWHWLKRGRPDAAEPILSQLVSDRPDPAARAGNDIARHWLTRLDREKVKGALQAIYRAQIEYPESFATVAALPQNQRPPLTDRWEKPWEYQREDFKRIGGVHGQRYRLESAVLKENSDLAEALRKPYANSIRLRPVRVLSGGGTAQAVVEFSVAGTGSVVLSAGTGNGGVTFVTMRENWLVLADGDYWLLAPAPK